MTTLNDIFAGNQNRPDVPDFWRLSEIILALKADMEESTSEAEKERRWRKHYEEIGDFDAIAYCAIQAGLEVHGLQTAADLAMLTGDPSAHRSYIASVQTYFDGFLMGAMFVQKGGHRE